MSDNCIVCDHKFDKKQSNQMICNSPNCRLGRKGLTLDEIKKIGIEQGGVCEISGVRFETNSDGDYLDPTTGVLVVERDGEYIDVNQDAERSGLMEKQIKLAQSKISLEEKISKLKIGSKGRSQLETRLEKVISQEKAVQADLDKLPPETPVYKLADVVFEPITGNWRVKSTLKRVAIDHEHGGDDLVRGLLIEKVNWLLDEFKRKTYGQLETPESIKKYLKSPPAERVGVKKKFLRGHDPA